jgi:hypothetical protein
MGAHTIPHSPVYHSTSQKNGTLPGIERGQQRRPALPHTNRPSQVKARRSEVVDATRCMCGLVTTGKPVVHPCQQLSALPLTCGCGTDDPGSLAPKESALSGGGPFTQGPDYTECPPSATRAVFSRDNQYQKIAA